MSCHSGKDAHVLLGGIWHYPVLESRDLGLFFPFKINLAI